MKGQPGVLRGEKRCLGRGLGHLNEADSQSHGGAGDFRPRRPRDPYFIRSAGTFAVVRLTREWR